MLIGTATSSEALLAFLRAELDSPTEAHRLRRTLEELRLPERVIARANADDPTEEDARWRIFAKYRGFEEIFQGLQLRDLEWHRARLTADHLRTRVRTCRHHFEATFGTRDPAAIADALNLRTPREPNGVLDRVRRGEELEPPLLLSAKPSLDRLVILEGHNRLISYLRDPSRVPFPIGALVGISPDVSRWREW